MIAVTRLNGSRFAVNPDLIERIQENPDTTLVMVGGATYVVREGLPEVIGLSDRIYTISEGRITAEVSRDDGVVQPLTRMRGRWVAISRFQLAWPRPRASCSACATTTTGARCACA